MAEAIISQEGNTSSSDWQVAILNYTISDDWTNINPDERFFGIMDPVYTNYLTITYPIVFNNREFNTFSELYAAVGQNPVNLLICYPPYGGQWVGNKEINIGNIANTNELAYIAARSTQSPTSPIYIAAKFVD